MQFIAVLGFLLQMASAAACCHAIATKPVSPNRVSWLLWATIPLVASVIAIQDGAGWGVLPVLGASLGPWIVLFFAIVRRRGSWQFTPLSITCLVVSLSGLAIQIVGFGIVASIAVMVTEFSAALPTIAKAWKDPQSESALTYLLSGTSAVTALLTINTFNLQQAGFPMMVTLLMFTIALIVIVKGKVTSPSA
jgi:hypothetical protein